MATTSTSISRRTQEKRTAISDAAMAHAAVRLICERGTAATTLKEVGLAAGYSRGLAGYRFGSKAGLWSFLIKTIGDEWLAELRHAVAGRAGLGTIHAAVDAHSRFLVDSPNRIRAFYILWFDSVGPHSELREVIAKVHERRRRDVEEWIRDGIADGSVRADADIRAVAEQFVTAVIGITYQWLVSPSEHDRVRQLHTDLKEQMTRALGA